MRVACWVTKATETLALRLQTDTRTKVTERHSH
jgi:hypothetical protein